MKLTKKVIDCLLLPEEKPFFIWDDELKGFGLRVNPSSKVYIVQGRVGGKVRRVTIGKHGTFTLQQARERAADILREMVHGKDPVTEKKRKEALSVTLEEVKNAYIKDRSLKARTETDIRRHVRDNFSEWKDKPISGITRQKCLSRFREISDRSPAQANQAFRVLRGLLNYAMATYRPEDRPILTENPVSIISDAKLWHNVQAKNRRIPNNQVGMIFNFLQKERENPFNTDEGRTVADAVLFMLLTGARRTEALSLKWEHVDIQGQSWRILDPKNRHPVTLPLSTFICTLLSERPRVNDYVFFSKKATTGHISEPKHTVKKISEMIGTTISSHDLRRTFRAIAGECGIELWRTKLLLNHRMSGDVTLESYTETSDCRYLLPEIQKISDWVERQGVQDAAGNVITLNHARSA
ncbi:tyrosine-type recombinase/integrase [Desulfobotulus mexicanus]|nr:tyrosine-type recombinase/integrase [Desulfobotulus mexicanus]